ncbi:phage portal protein, lambda family [Pseudogulbenkiania sp. NH8B]|uniref:phage portal protein n=1 Tax=Pseudogulbenkiania sp. (strain NH8B) TaxID=748280 RepID=UPI0002279A91|nr:phage portal protein [Pseudogulbenkiania sp. NH8B]BAK75811.1 phage portal protein, lambda family [Pseudogulbenkiania sp. NH8B]
MNLIDSLVGFFSPMAGVRRWQARQALEHVRAYEGAKKGRRTAGWNTPGTSANAENLMALPTLRNRSHDLVRNNPWCKKALETWVGDAIGAGIRLGISKGHAAGKGWLAWAETTACDADGLSDLYGLQALAGRCMWESGAVIIRRRWRRTSDGLPVPFQVQVLEPDYLDHDKTEETKTGYILGGVEFDKLGRRVAYWLFDQHPGEASRYGRVLQSRRVPADDVIYAFKRLRPGQIHGVPELAPVILRARDLDDYEDAELTRKKVEACFSVFVTSEGGAGSGVGDVGQDAKGRPTERVAPGMIKRLLPGESVTFGQPTATAGYADYVRAGHRALAAGAGQTYEQLSGDLSQVNYSSLRGGMLPYRRSIEAWQWLCFVPMVCQRIVGWYNEAADLVGKRPIPTGTEWSVPKLEWTDPVKDMKGELLKVAAGVQSFSELQRRLGNQPETVLAELTADWERLREAGIPISLDGLIALLATPDEPSGANDGKA